MLSKYGDLHVPWWYDYNPFTPSRNVLRNRLGRDADEVVDWIGASASESSSNDGSRRRYLNPGLTRVTTCKGSRLLIKFNFHIIKFLHELTNVPVPRLLSRA
jgi:hypothetical protein